MALCQCHQLVRFLDLQNRRRKTSQHSHYDQLVQLQQKMQIRHFTRKLKSPRWGQQQRILDRFKQHQKEQHWPNLLHPNSNLKVYQGKNLSRRISGLQSHRLVFPIRFWVRRSLQIDHFRCLGIQTLNQLPVRIDQLNSFQVFRRWLQLLYCHFQRWCLFDPRLPGKSLG